MTKNRLGRSMRRFRRSERGLSEIVGTLMLVVIVVAAATLLAAFVASYQKQLQTEETQSHDQSLESIEILGLTTTVSGGVFSSFSFSLASEYVNPSGVLDVSINSHPLIDFGWQNITTHTFGIYNVGSVNGLVLQPFDQLVVTLCLTSAPCTFDGQPLNFSFLAPSDVPLPNYFIKFDVLTHLHNDFTKVYLPPTPFGVVSEINPSPPNAMTLLDGSTSFQPGGNASIVNWSWSVTGGGPDSNTQAAMTTALNGSATNGALHGGTTYTGTAAASFTVPSTFSFVAGTDSVALVDPPDLSVTGPGCSGTLQAIIASPPPTGITTGTSVNITFGFTVTVVGSSCAAGALSIPAGGLILTPTAALAPDLNVTGEEYEVSPALPAPISAQTPYLVTLAVTNSDGLSGSITLTYVPA